MEKKIFCFILTSLPHQMALQIIRECFRCYSMEWLICSEKYLLCEFQLLIWAYLLPVWLFVYLSLLIFLSVCLSVCLSFTYMVVWCVSMVNISSRCCRPFTYDIHTEAVNVLLVLMSGQVFTTDPSSTNVIITMATSVSQYVTIVLSYLDELLKYCCVSRQLANALVQTLLNHFVSQPPPPPEYLRSHPAGLVSSITC